MPRKQKRRLDDAIPRSLKEELAKPRMSKSAKIAARNLGTNSSDISESTTSQYKLAKWSKLTRHPGIASDSILASGNRTGQMAPPSMAPHLVERDGVKSCSACSMKFPHDAQPSLSKAFVNHVRDTHPSALKIQPASVVSKKKLVS